MSVRDYYDTMKRRTLAILEGIVNGDDRKDAIEQLTDRLVLWMKPKCFTGSKSVEIGHDKDFESLCLTIQKETGADPKRMTVLEFYNAYEYIRKLSKERQKSVPKR